MIDKNAVYILFSKPHGTLYTGVTADLRRRIVQQKLKQEPNSFTARYGVDKLGYYEFFDSIQDAIDREKQIKAGSRIQKNRLIQSVNPEWRDLFDYLY